MGGPCNNCAGRGQVGTPMAIVQLVVVLALVVFFAVLVLQH